jgi:hypothetical protein
MNPAPWQKMITIRIFGSYVVQNPALCFNMKSRMKGAG